jgi:hypothetical protein
MSEGGHAIIIKKVHKGGHGAITAALGKLPTPIS